MGTNDRLIKKMYYGILVTNVISIISGIGCTMIDSIVTGQFLGPDAVAASGLIQPVVMIVNLFGTLIGGGVGVVCIRHMGKARLDRANQAYSITLIASVICFVILTCLLFLSAPSLSLVLSSGASSSEIPVMIRDYLRAFCPGMLPMRLTILFAGIMMLDNDRMRAIYAMGSTLLADIVFDLANAVIFHGGMFGMAVATSLSNVVGFLVIMTHFLRKNRVLRFSFRDLHIGDLGDVILGGIPGAVSSGSQAVRGLCFNVFLLQAAGQGAVAALAVCNGAFSIVNAAAIGMFISASVLSGMLYGEEDRSGLGYGIRIAVRATFAVLTVISVLAFVFPGQVAGLFIKSSAVDVFNQGARFIRFMAVQFFLMSVSYPVSGFYQGVKNVKLNFLIDLMREAVLPIACVLIGGRLFGLRGVETGFAAAGALVLVVVFLIPVICNKKFPVCEQDLLVLPDDFGAKPEELYEASMRSMEDVMKVSEEVMGFVRDRGADRRDGIMLPLFIEEMAKNTITHGFGEGRRGSVDLRLVYRKDSKMIRLRDDGIPFDPVKWMEHNSGEDPSSGIGIRMVTGLARDVDYVPAMEMNNLLIHI